MSFDLLVPHYTWMERVLAGPRLQRCRIAWLEALAGCENILIVGVGHGHFLRACAQRFPAAQITSVDASRGMLREAERRAQRAGLDRRQLKFVHASLPAWRPEPESFNAVVTNFFLDCFPPDELSAVIAALATGAKPNARWLVSDFAVPSHGLARQRARAVHTLMYIFFRHVTRIAARRLTEPGTLLAREGFALARRRSWEWGLLSSELWLRGAEKA